MKNYTRKTIEFYNKHFKDYVKSGAVVLKNKIDKFAKLINRRGKILDVGCGPGHDTDYLTKKGFDCLGIDLSEKMIDHAKKNFEGKFKVMDFFNLKFKENSFDGIWCSSALIHADRNDLNNLLKNFWKTMRKEGFIGMITPAKQKRTKKKNDTRLFTICSKEELEEYLKNNGFKVTHSEIFFYEKLKLIFIISKKI